MKAGGSSRREWVVDVEKTLQKADAAQVSRWQRRSIYRVPACIKDLYGKVYRPQVVSLGPFHHGAPDLVPMEEHKRRALQHLLWRAGRPLGKFVAAVDEVLEELASAYLDFGAEWLQGDGRQRFQEMMVLDGCFLLEVMRAAVSDGKGGGDDYAPNDPIFSRHGVLYMVHYIRRDMLILENQLPLLLLHKLVAVVETAKPPAQLYNTRGELEYLLNLNVWDYMSYEVENIQGEMSYLLKKARHIRRYKYMSPQDLVPMEDALGALQVNLVAFEEAAKGAKFYRA